jgi:hypothetical protein
VAAAALVTAIAVICLGAPWELVEWAADNTAGPNDAEGYEDTVTDLAVDTIAAVGAAAIVAVRLRTGSLEPPDDPAGGRRGHRRRSAPRGGRND